MRGGLPKELVLRAPAMADLGEVNRLIRACEMAEYALAESTEDDLLSDWERARFDLGRDAWLVVEPEGRIAAYAGVWDRAEHVQLVAQGYVHPERWGRGIGRELVRLTEARAREHIPLAPPGERVTLNRIVAHSNERARRLLEQEGYRAVRYHWRMVIEVEEPPPAPEWPEGTAVRTFVPGEDDAAVHGLIQEAFTENEGYWPLPLDEWAGFMIERETFDASLWFLATAGEEIVGAALCPDYPEMGWVRQLAVRRSWRRRGLALALLRHAFGELYRRGRRRVGLVVDSYNRRGAKALYERAGMHVALQHDSYEKEMRAAEGTRRQG